MNGYLRNFHKMVRAARKCGRLVPIAYEKHRKFVSDFISIFIPILAVLRF